jgi:hypothetical protein
VAGIERLQPRLYRWTARHPAWQPGAEPGSPGEWGPEVGCVAFAIERGMVVVDPQVPPDEAAFWEEMDPLVAAAGGHVRVLQTMRWHGRSRVRFVERYDASCPPIMAAEIDVVPAQRRLPGGGEQVDDGQHRVEPRHARGHRRLGHEERAGDVRRADAAHQIHPRGRTRRSDPPRVRPGRA